MKDGNVKLVEKTFLRGFEGKNQYLESTQNLTKTRNHWFYPHSCEKKCHGYSNSGTRKYW